MSSPATEAQKVLNITLTKIAKSRSERCSASLHKNLLVAAVLQKARFQIYMEDVRRSMWNNSVAYDTDNSSDEEEETNIVSDVDYIDILSSPSCTPAEENNKENSLPETESTYFDLDSRLRESGSPTINVVLRENKSNSGSCESLKRKHGISDWETEDAVLSILPKRARLEDDDVFSNNDEEDQEQDAGTSMEIDRITSLVSIFSFGLVDPNNSNNNSANNITTNKLTRTVSTPDLCAAQAKECSDPLQDQRQYLAMLV